MTLPIFGSPPASGCYFNPVSNGHGLDVHTKDGKTVIYWYTGRTTGEPRFLFATGEAGAELDLITIIRATQADPTSGVEHKVGSCRFTGNTFAWILDGVRGGVEVEPVVLSESSGIFYDPKRNNEGITVQFFGDRCAVFFYTYRGNAIGQEHTDTWYSFEGVLNDGVYRLKAFETTGPFMTAALKTKEVGTGLLNILSDNSVHFLFAENETGKFYDGRMVRIV